MMTEHSPREHPLMTCEEAAAYLRLHPRTVGRLLRVRTLPGVKVGSQWRLRRADLDAYLVGQGGTPAGAAPSAAPAKSADTEGSPRGGVGAVAAR